MNQQAAHILQEHNLRQTESRQDILLAFLAQASALSHAEIETRLASNFDRVTVYRTLKTFLDKGIIHKVLDDGTGVKYALCKDHCHDNHHHHEHVHFKCTECGQTNCMEEVTIPAVQLPKGYKAEEKNLLVQGVCAQCNR
ncbi:transcriptional repressor [Cytophagales bacterium LB-30]|uniref:Transcriptional repressor n=1 Tax=Shiella aurantiaca TaxID=3058365 RepID=A0ABT8F5W1_9BACT|nr:transcriptional repressor [Shiella aurantiaca]MDN4165840.1 transcriptional repressor [Shiella aurantiaca]